VNHRYTDPDVLELARDIAARLPDSDIVALARSARDSLGPEAGPMALSLARQWEKQRVKFPSWPEFVGDRTAFEQASGEYAATWRAKRFSGLRVLDLCCGAGGDTVALSNVATEVIAVDRDTDRLDWARHNVTSYGQPERVSFLCTDCSDPLPDADAAVLDPDRRAGSTRDHATRGHAGRAVHPEDYSPPVEIWEQIRRGVHTLGVKVAPGIPYESIPDGAVSEFIESRGECREAVLWFGDGSPSARQAVLLPTQDVISADEPEETAIGGIGEAIYDPGPATVRAHLITHLASRLSMQSGTRVRRIDEQIAYLTSDGTPQSTPFAAAFYVEAVVPWSLKRVQAELSVRKIGALEIRSRRFPIRPDDLRKRLRLKGSEQRTLICTRVAGEPVAVIAKRV
jgi:SAM-dependent methyltransferase